MEPILFIQDLAVILLIGGAAGWICQRLGLSSVAGYLIAGCIVGPHTPPFALVTDIPRIQTLAQVGLVFLVFSIGLRLSLSRLRRMGLGLLLAVAASAGILYALTRVAGNAAGLGNVTTLFVAGMLMVSSSAIISRVLADARITHEHAGQLALGVTVLEDIVAVMMLTLLSSIVQFGGANPSARLGETLTLLVAFVVLAGVVGLLVVPRLLRRMSAFASDELQALGIAGLLFGMALLAQRAGYSTALGAFLLGAIVAETPNRAQVERIFEGMRDVFSAVFFVAIGMQIDPANLAHVALPIVGWTAFALFARVAASSLGLTLTGVPTIEALRTGLLLVPIGEFSFIIIQMGVDSSVVPQDYYPMIVGVSLLTTLMAPFLARNSDRIAAGVIGKLPKWASGTLNGYQTWLEKLLSRPKQNKLWLLSRKRIIQISVGMLFVTGLCVFSGRLLEVFVGWVGPNWLFPMGPATIFWILLLLVALPPLVAIWRNLSAMAMLYAEIGAKGHAYEARLRVFIEHGLRVLAGAGLAVWLASILPFEESSRWMLYSVGVLALLALILLRRKFILWHSEAEIDLQSVLSPAAGVPGSAWLESRSDWRLGVMECVVPDLAEYRGRSLRDIALRSRLGATVVGIERQGLLIPLPGPQEILYPRDKLLIMGSPEQGRAAVRYLQSVSFDPEAESDTPIEDIRVEKIDIVDTSPAVGLGFGAIEPTRRFGVILAGLQRGESRVLNPRADEPLLAGDQLLALGTVAQLRRFRTWIDSAGRSAH